MPHFEHQPLGVIRTARSGQYVRSTAMRMVFLLSCFGQSAFAQQVLLTIDGLEPGRSLQKIDCMGDMNGDSVPDILGGAEGRARVFSGSSGSILLEATGSSSDGFGGSVCCAGDFDGDGVNDFAVGATADDTAGSSLGAVHVYSGVDATELATMYGEFYEEGLGYHMAGLGDVDGDGFDDIGVTSQLHRRVRIYGGPDGHLIRYHVMGAQGTTRPSVARVGDVNNDGRPDYVIGWPQDSTGGSLTGTVALFSGRNGALLRQVHGPIPTGGGLTGSHLGVTVSGVGDWDGDGKPDFAAGAPGCVDFFFGSTQGLVRVYSGRNGNVLAEWTSTTSVAGTTCGTFGFSVAGGGDLNADGFPDLLVGAPLDPGMPADPARGTVSAFSGRTGERLWRLVGLDDTGRMHYCAILGNLNHDGIADFATGDGSADMHGTNSGRITVYAGAPGDLERHCSGDPLSMNRSMRLETFGALGIGNDYLKLSTHEATPNALALFLYGPPTQRQPMGPGWLCTGQPSYLLSPPLAVDANGSVELALDFTQPPLGSGPGQVIPGSTWSFQLWCRDPATPGHSPRLSDGLAITFPP